MEKFITEFMNGEVLKLIVVLITEFVSVIAESYFHQNFLSSLGFGIAQIPGTWETGPFTAGSDSA